MDGAVTRRREEEDCLIISSLQHNMQGTKVVALKVLYQCLFQSFSNKTLVQFSQINCWENCGLSCHELSLTLARLIDRQHVNTLHCTKNAVVDIDNMPARCTNI
jgi:hypothetical protein